MLKEFSYKGLGLAWLLVLSFSSISLAQGRGNTGDTPVIARDRCRVIYKELQKTHKTDTLAMQKLLENYVFDNQVRFAPKQWEKALLYIMKEENEQLQCSLKSFILEKSLLLEKKK